MKSALLASAIVLVMLPSPAAAQSDAAADSQSEIEAGGLVDIVVTAQRREENLQHTALAASGTLSRESRPHRAMLQSNCER